MFYLFIDLFIYICARLYKCKYGLPATETTWSHSLQENTETDSQWSIVEDRGGFRGWGGVIQYKRTLKTDNIAYLEYIF